MSFCKPAIDALPRTWITPNAPKSGDTTVPVSFKFALLALTFSDVTSPPATSVAQHFSTGAYKEYMDAATSGCVDYTMDAYEAPLGTEKVDGSCAITHAEDVPALTVAGFDPSSYDIIIFMVVQSECGTSGGMGPMTHTINGVSVTFSQLFMSVRTSELAATSCPGETWSPGWSCPLYSSQKTALHEMIHGLGLGQHSNAYQCLAEPTDTLKCEAAEYGDLFDVMGKKRYLMGLSARMRY